MPGRNGWRTGNDPTLRALRGVAVSALIGLLVWWVIFDPQQNPFVGALLIGFLLAALFGDISIALPYLRTERRAEEDDQRTEEVQRFCPVCGHPREDHGMSGCSECSCTRGIDRWPSE